MKCIQNLNLNLLLQHLLLLLAGFGFLLGFTDSVSGRVWYAGRLVDVEERRNSRWCTDQQLPIRHPHHFHHTTGQVQSSMQNTSETECHTMLYGVRQRTMDLKRFQIVGPVEMS